MTRDWVEQAACRDSDPVAFDLETEQAYWTCTRCPVITQCRADAMQPEGAGGAWGPGIRGALTLDQRISLKRYGRYRPAEWQRGTPRRANPGILSFAEQQARYALWLKGLSDLGIAEELGIRKEAVKKWRGRYRPKDHPEGLPSNVPPVNPPLSIGQLALRINMVAAGCGDAEIAEQCGTTKSAVKVWRRRQARKDARAANDRAVS